MAPDRRPDRISDLYHAALKRPPAERSAFLTAACEDDEALREEVESLLAYDAASAPFLEQPAAIALGAGIGTADIVHRQLGPYTILAPLGAGGMGEVYRARDTKLGRDVAIKILPSHFTADPERRARFAREARLLATLNHPHIGAIYGLEQGDGADALVLELVEGPTLASRLERGPLPVAEALVVARQIADALNEAHEHGIIHRDLKPANIVLQGKTDPGPGDVRVKVLDFGLAKPMPVDLATSPTAAGSGSFDGTADGRILGTPAYMSPEQARGQTVDKRTDIWALGCVLYEMLSGRRAFAGKTITDTLVGVLEHEPDWSALPAETPLALRTMLERCLRKDPRKRLHDIADAVIELDDGVVGAANAPATLPAVPPRHTREWLAWTTAAVLAAVSCALAAAVYSRLGSSLGGDAVESLAVPPADSFFHEGHFAIAPGGQQLALVAAPNGPRGARTSKLWVRRIDRLSWRPLAGTEGAEAPFWSPDSQSLGFFADGKLKTVRVSGGLAVPLCDAPRQDDSSGTWGSAGVILFTADFAGLKKVPATGGEPTAVEQPAGDFRHRYPSFLPDGQHFLYVALRGNTGEVRVGSLTSTVFTSLGPSDSGAVYGSGYLLSVRSGKLTAQPFDATTRQIKGDPVVLAEPVAVVHPVHRGAFSASATGVLGHSAAGRPPQQLTWRDRDGKVVGIAGEPGVFVNIDLSRDDRHVAVSQLTEQPGNTDVDVWLIDLDRGGTATRLSHPELQFDPTLSPDGKQIAFISGTGRTGSEFGLYVMRADGSGQVEALLKAPLVSGPDWSPGGDFLVYSQGGDVWTLPLRGERRPSEFLKTSAGEAAATISPDGRWIAYESDESGREEVYIRPFPRSAGVIKVSRNGGVAPRWRADGNELFFLSLDGKMMSATKERANGRWSVPKPLFQTEITGYGGNPYDVTRDGRRFLIPVTLEDDRSITLVLNWPALLRRSN